MVCNRGIRVTLVVGNNGSEGEASLGVVSGNGAALEGVCSFSFFSSVCMLGIPKDMMITDRKSVV